MDTGVVNEPHRSFTVPGRALSALSQLIIYQQLNMDFTVSRPEIKKLVCKYSVEGLAATFNMEEVLVGPSPGTV